MSNKTKRNGFSLVSLCMLLTLGLWTGEARGDGGHSLSIPTTDRAETKTKDGYILRMRLLPKVATVGQLATIQVTLTKDGHAVQVVDWEMTFRQMEDNKEVFSSRYRSLNGKMTWQNQFFDGAPHRITIRAHVVPERAGGKVTTIQTAMNIHVIPIQPPKPVVFRMLAILLSVIALTMTIGYVVGVGKLS